MLKILRQSYQLMYLPGRQMAPLSWFLSVLFGICNKKQVLIYLNARIQEHVLPLYDLTMLNSAVSFVQHQITLR